MKRCWLTSGLLLLVGCASTQGITPTCIEGVIRDMGLHASSTILLEAPQGRYLIEGESSDRLKSLVGGEIGICGLPSGEPPVRRLEMSGYQIVRMNGEPAYEGVLAFDRGGGVSLITQADTLELMRPPPEFHDNVGREVWISGNRDEGQLSVSGYGWLTPD